MVESDTRRTQRPAPDAAPDAVRRGQPLLPVLRKERQLPAAGDGLRAGRDDGPHFDQFYPDRPVDASHPDMLLDFNRCILCELCVRASRDVDGKNVFAICGRGITNRTWSSTPSRAGSPTPPCRSTDRAASVCPVGVILPKRPRLPRARSAKRASTTCKLAFAEQVAGGMPERDGEVRVATVNLATVSLASAATCRCSTSTSACSTASNSWSSTARRSPTSSRSGRANRPHRGRRCATRRTCTCCASSASTARSWSRSAPAPSTAACRRSATTSTLRDVLAEVYVTGTGLAPGSRIPNDPELPLPLNKVHPIHEVVKVDYFLPGCPPSADAIWKFLTDLLAGRTPHARPRPAPLRLRARP